MWFYRNLCIEYYKMDIKRGEIYMKQNSKKRNISDSINNNNNSNYNTCGRDNFVDIQK